MSALLPLHRAIALSALLLTLTACSGPGGASAPTSASVTGPPSVQASSPAAPSSTSPASPSGPLTVPQHNASLPTGVYRTRVTRDELVAHGDDDLSNAGIWTLTVAPGTYQLDCRPIADPGYDCGNSPSPPTLKELGALRGDGQQAWFIRDINKVAALTGCIPHSEQQNGCGPEATFRLTWAGPSELRFSDYTDVDGTTRGARAAVNFTLKPWQKIG